jgi:hypothetical protein
MFLCGTLSHFALGNDTQKRTMGMHLFFSTYLPPPLQEFPAMLTRNKTPNGVGLFPSIPRMIRKQVIRLLQSIPSLKMFPEHQHPKE